MRHPFDGVNQPESGLTRRAALGTLAAAAAGVVGLAQARAQDRIATTDALGEEGGPIATTLAIGEEGGRTGVAQATTEPFGEEAGKVVSRAVPGLEDGGAAQPMTEAKGEEGTVPPTLAINEGGIIATTRALGEEGGRLTKAKGEEGMGGVLVPVKPGTTELKDEQLKAVWADLGAKDAARGVQACAVLYGAKNGVSYIKATLKPEAYRLPQADAGKLDKLIADLDADTFATRETAETELQKLGQAAQAALEKAFQNTKSAEARMRIERLLEQLKEQSAQTQARRAMEVLVALKTPEAKEVLEALGKGDAKEWLTQAARQALERASK
jgi:hypothetical protein